MSLRKINLSKLIKAFRRSRKVHVKATCKWAILTRGADGINVFIGVQTHTIKMPGGQTEHVTGNVWSVKGREAFLFDKESLASEFNEKIILLPGSWVSPLIIPAYVKKEKI